MTLTKAAFIPPSTIEISVLVPVMNEAGNIRPLIEEISDKDGKRQVISLWTLGEIGKRTKLDDSNGIDNTLWKKLEEDNTDEVKTAAAFALGSCAVGNKDAFLPKILETIKTTKKGVQEIKKHGALRALREVIIGADGSSEDGVLAGESSKMEYMMSPRKKRVKREDDDVLFKSTQQAWAVVLAKARDLVAVRGFAEGRQQHARRFRSTSARALCNRNSCTASLDESRLGVCPHL